MNDNDEKKHEIKSDPIAEFKRAREQALKDELKEEAVRMEAEAEVERQKREAYAKKLADERRDLLKLKAGIASDEVKEEFAPQEKTEEVLPFGKRIANFWYHSKATVIVSLIVVIALVYTVMSIFFETEPDVIIMYIKTDPNMSFLTDEIGNALAPYCPDFNGDGKVYIQVGYNPAIPAAGVDVNFTQAQSARLFVEFNGDKTVLIFTDKAAIEALGITTEIFDDPKTWFPDSPNIDDTGYKVSTTDLGELVGYPELSDNLYAVFRTPGDNMGKLEVFEANNKNAHTLWQNFISGNIINPDQENFSK
jgi:hypothetical protein